MHKPGARLAPEGRRRPNAFNPTHARRVWQTRSGSCSESPPKDPNKNNPLIQQRETGNTQNQQEKAIVAMRITRIQPAVETSSLATAEYMYATGQLTAAGAPGSNSRKATTLTGRHDRQSLTIHDWLCEALRKRQKVYWKTSKACMARNLAVDTNMAISSCH